MNPVVPCNPDGIPEALRAYLQCIVWKMLPPRKEGTKPVKMPCDPKTGREASATDPSTWGTYEQAVTAFRRGGYAGIGFVFTADDPFIGADMDNCRNPQTGELTQAAQIALALCDTYAEISQSGTGIKFIGIGKKVGDRCKDDAQGVEMYDHARFFALTGDRLPDAPETIEDRQAEFAGLYRLWFPEKQKPQRDTAPRPALTSGATDRLSDEGLLQKAFAARNGAEIQALYQGALGGKPTESEARAALLYHLWFYAGSEWGDGATQLERLLWSSQRDKSKWDDKRGTVSFLRYECEKAIERYTGEFYSPGRLADVSALMPPEEESKSEAELTVEAWEKRGKRLYAWKSACDEEFKWRVADWYNEKVRALEEGERFKSVKKIFKNLAYQIQKWAYAAAKWSKEERRPSLPFWLHQELAAQTEAVRNDIMRDFTKGGMKREDVRARIGEKQPAKPLKWWQVVKADLPEDLGAALARHLEADPQDIVTKLKELLLPNKRQSTLPGYFADESDDSLVDTAKRFVQAVQEAEDEQEDYPPADTVLSSKSGVFASENATESDEDLEPVFEGESDELLPPLDPLPPENFAYTNTVIEDNPSTEPTDPEEALLQAIQQQGLAPANPLIEGMARRFGCSVYAIYTVIVRLKDEGKVRNLEDEEGIGCYALVRQAATPCTS